jgi:hypothetical protein
MTPDHLKSDTTCPQWCIADHSLFEGEDAQVHLGVNEQLANQITVRLVASHAPDTGAMDGPYLLVDAPHLALDSHELHLDEARTIGETLIDLADRGAHHATMLAVPARRLMDSTA